MIDGGVLFLIGVVFVFCNMALISFIVRYTTMSSDRDMYRDTCHTLIETNIALHERLRHYRGTLKDIVESATDVDDTSSDEALLGLVVDLAKDALGEGRS